MTSDVFVAIPVKNEADRIAGCLEAFAGQTGLPGTPVPRFTLLLFFNNCEDASAQVAREAAERLGLRCDIVEAQLTGAEASAGGARRIAMRESADRLAAQASGVVMTTDADSCVPPDWVARNLAAIADGADAVAGRIVIDPADYSALPDGLRRRITREMRYERLVCEIESRLSPSPHDPWPRHSHNSGASLAITLAAFQRVGGVPSVPVGEDRALLTALRKQGGRVRHAPEVTVTTSGRLLGRAAGGYADTMRRRATAPQTMCDPYLRPLWSVVRGVAACETRTGIRPSMLDIHTALAIGCVAILRLADALSSASQSVLVAFVGRRDLSACSKSDALTEGLGNG